MVSVSSLRRRRTILESIERSNASALSAGAAAMMSSRDSTLRGLARNSRSRAIWPGGKLLLAARPVHDQRRLEIDGGVLEHDELAPTLAAAGDEAADAGGEFAPVDRAGTTSAAPSSSASTFSIRSAGPTAIDETRAGLAGMPPQQVEAEARRKALADDGDVDVRRRQQRFGRPVLGRLAHLVAAAFEIVAEAVSGILRHADKRDDRPCTHALNPLPPELPKIAGHHVYTQSTFRR